MNRTIKDATVKRFYYVDLTELAHNLLKLRSSSHRSILRTCSVACWNIDTLKARFADMTED